MFDDVPLLDPHAEMRETVRDCFARAMYLYPNSHLGTYTRREDLQSAKRFIRSRLNIGWSLREAIGDLQRDLDRYEDM